MMGCFFMPKNKYKQIVNNTQNTKVVRFVRLLSDTLYAQEG